MYLSLFLSLMPHISSPISGLYWLDYSSFFEEKKYASTNIASKRSLVSPLATTPSFAPIQTLASPRATVP